MKHLTAIDLAAGVVRGLLAQAGIGPAQVEELILGQAIPAGTGPNPAAEVARSAGLNRHAAAFTVNRGNASGLQAVILAARSIQGGEVTCGLAGGMESSSSAPYLLPTARWGTRMGAAPVLDALLQDGPPPPPISPTGPPQPMPGEILPMGELAGDETGAAGPGDGAAILLLGTPGVLGARTPLARIRAWGQGHGAQEAIQHALDRADLSLPDLDLVEGDWPWAGQSPAGWGAAGPRINARGGTLGLPHAAGAEAARSLVALTHQLRQPGFHRGLAVALDGQGLALALILETP